MRSVRHGLEHYGECVVVVEVEAADTVGAAISYIRMGLRVVPIPAGEKAPKLSGWQNLKMAEVDSPKYFSGKAGGNVGVLLGIASGLVDIDLDDRAAAELAPQFLPPTSAIFGRPGKPRSHWVYSVANPHPTRRHQWSPTDRRTIVEYRATGAQTVFPPSTHPSGEAIAWDGDFAPAAVDGVSLSDAVQRLADAVRERGAVGNLAFDSSTVAPLAPISPMSRCKAYLSKCPDAISGESGHNCTLMAACECFRFGLSADECSEVMHWFNETKCRPQWTAKELKHKLIDGEKLVRASGDFGKRLRDDSPPSWPAVVPLESVTVTVEDFGDDSAADTLAVQTFPKDLMTPPGFVGELCQFFIAAAIKPQPILALGAALSFFGAVVGRKVATETDLRTNLYSLGVGESGSGKDSPRDTIKNICKTVGITGEIIGGESVSSDAALLSATSRCPSVLFQFDEIGHLFKSFAAKNAANYERGIPVTLMKLFSSANTTFIGKEYADSKLCPRVDIEQPNVCLYGTSVARELFNGLTPDDVSNGFLNRMLVFVSEDPDPIEQLPNKAVPQRIVDVVTLWWKRKVPNPAKGNLEATESVPIVVRNTPLAAAVFAAFDAICRTEKAKGRSGHGYDALWARAKEHAYKIALVIAAGVDYELPEISEEIARYACDLVEHLTRNLVGYVSRNVAGSEYERQLQRMLRYITDAGISGLSSTALTKKCQAMEPRMRQTLIADLLQQEKAIRLERQTNGRPAVVFFDPTFLPYRRAGVIDTELVGMEICGK